MLGRSDSPSFLERERYFQGVIFPSLFSVLMVRIAFWGCIYLSLLISCEHLSWHRSAELPKPAVLPSAAGGSLLSLPACVFLWQIRLGQSWLGWSHEGLVYLAQLSCPHAPHAEGESRNRSRRCWECQVDTLAVLVYTDLRCFGVTHPM